MTAYRVNSVPVFTLTATGTLVGRIVFESPGYLAYQKCYFAMSALGCVLGASSPGSDPNRVVSDWTVSNNWAPDGGTTFTDFTTTEYDVGGSYAVSVQAALWVDIEPLAGVDTDNGTYTDPQAYTARFYLMQPEGSAYSSTITSMGITASGSGTHGTASEINLAHDVVIRGWNNHNAAAGADNTLTVQCIPYTNDKIVAGRFDMTATDGTRFRNDIGVSMAFAAATAADDAASAYQFGDITLNGYPEKTFSLVCALKSCDAPYPGTVDVYCPLTAVDSSPVKTISDGAALSGTQRQRDSSLLYNRRHSADSGGSAGADGTLIAADDNAHEYCPIAPSIDTAWTRANGEYVTYTTATADDPPVSIEHYIDNAAGYLQGWSFPGLTLSQAGALTVDDGTSAEHWMGAETVSGGLQNTGTAAMVRTFIPFANFSGYRYLKVSGAKVATGTASLTLAIGGKAWTKPVTTTVTDLVFDLCFPDTGGAAVDITDTVLPDANPTVHYGADSGTDDAGGGAADGPLWGVTYATALTLSGWGEGTFSFGGLTLARQYRSEVDMLVDWTPRFEQDMTALGPQYSTSGGDTFFTTKQHRGLIAKTDGLKQSLELPSLYAVKTDGPSGIHYSGTSYTINDWAEDVNAGGLILGPATDTLTFGDFQRVVNGWSATVDAAANDASTNLQNGFLKSDSPAAWLVGAGWQRKTGAWHCGIGLDATSGLSLTASSLFTSMDIVTGMEDLFALGDGTAGDGVTRLAFCWVSRAQSWGGVAMADGSAGTGKAITLTPGTGELQSSTTVVGTATTDTHGVFRTTGDGLDGYTTTGAVPTLDTTASGGVVTDTSD